MQDPICRCALSAASCYTERCTANAFCHLMRKGPQLPGLPRNCADIKCLLEVRPSEHGVAKTAQNCQRYPPVIVLALPPSPYCRRTEGRSSRHQKGRRAIGSKAMQMRHRWAETVTDQCRSPSPHSSATQRQRIRVLPGLFSFFATARPGHSESTKAYLRTTAAMESKRAVGSQALDSNCLHCHSY